MPIRLPPPAPGNPFQPNDLVIWPRCSLHPKARGYQFDPNDNSMWCSECWREYWKPYQQLTARGRELQEALRAVGLPEDTSIEVLIRHHRSAGMAIGGFHTSALLTVLQEAIDFIANVNTWTSAHGLLESNGPQLAERLRDTCSFVRKATE